MARAPVYKIVELSVVTDEALEETINHWVARGWQWDGVRFVVGEASRRPQMAFVSFVRVDGDGDGGARAAVDPAARAEPRQVKHYELGELDLGDPPPLEVELDHASKRHRPGKRKAR